MKKIEAYCFHRLSHLSFLLTTTGAAGLLKKNKQRNKKNKKQNQQWHFQYRITEFCSET